MDDYIQVMKDLLLEFYSISPEGNKTEWSTSQVWQWLKGIIPTQPITEHDVFDVLKELGYKKSQKILTEDVLIKKGNKNLGIQPEYEKKEVGRILVWNLYEKLPD